jgi:hypothetical protein
MSGAINPVTRRIPMPGLTRTDLQTSQKVDLAAAALAKQGKYGAVSCLAAAFDTSRPTVYRAASAANEALKLPRGLQTGHFCPVVVCERPSLHISPDVVMIAQDLGFPRAFATERNTRCIAEGVNVGGLYRDKRARGSLVRFAG